MSQTPSSLLDPGAARSKAGRRVGAVEICAAFVVPLLLGVCVWWAYQPPSVLQLGGDQSNIASFAVARDTPEAFPRDGLLSDPRSFMWYTPTYVHGIRWLARVTGGYPAAFVWLLIPTVTLFMSGSYFLWRHLAGSRVLAAGMTGLLSAVSIPMALGGDWCLVRSLYQMPRTQYLAILPWVLFYAVWSRSRIAHWPVVGICAALSCYIHPVSAPGWGLAIFGGLLAGSKGCCPLRKRLVRLALLAAVATAIVLPYAVIYLGTVSGRSPPADQYELVRKFAQSRLKPGYLDVRIAIERSLKSAGELPSGLRWFLLIWAVAGHAFAWYSGRETRALARFLLLGLVFFLVVTIGVTSLDQWTAARLRRLPVQIDLIRGLRYWPLWLLLLGAPGFRALCDTVARRASRPRIASTAVALAVLGTALFVSREGIVRQFTQVRAKTRTDPAFARRAADTEEVITFIEQNIPPPTAFQGPIWLRHTPGRAVVLTWKDSGAMLCANYDALSVFLERQLESQRVGNEWHKREAMYRGWGAAYVLLAAPKVRPYRDDQVVLANPTWELIRLSDRASAAGRPSQPASGPKANRK